MAKVSPLKGRTSNKSCECRLTPRKEEVLTMLKECGETQTMTYYNIKTRRTFRQWLRNHAKPAPITDMLSRLSGGRKTQWLRNHRDLILGICESNNDEVAISLFSITPDVLEELKHFQPTPNFKTTSVKADYVFKQVEHIVKEIDILKETDNVTNAKVSELREQQNNIITGLNNIYDGLVERLKPVLIATLTNALPIMKIEQTDPLNLETIMSQAQESKQKDQIAVLRAKLNQEKEYEQNQRNLDMKLMKAYELLEVKGEAIH